MRISEKGGSIYLDVGVWWDEDNECIRMTSRDARVPFHTTVNEDPESKRGHPNLFQHLAKCLSTAGAPHPPIVE